MPQSEPAENAVPRRERVCFLMHLKPDRVEDYLAVHEHVWPDMLDVLRRTGWHNYSLFLRADDGLVVGYLETDDYERAQREMAETDVNARWQATMAEFFVSESNPDAASERLTEYFHLA
ncbi:L-rhamnose mutarotase [Paramicrobacterium agarici]|uniref:L-rhamnose mutarotase n=1 Tax=Paramicrobacterium agarici TaxID=630514 RepID=UPI001154BD64|nr:L-rhamnose mutarotase [Microbacterium agarici]TQO21832.1 L-rhamnose mutarotase [Microbacterium agarici]